MTRRVVCAALKLTDGRLVLGARHYDDQMRQTLTDLVVVSWDIEAQGFIDQHCVFLTREEAWKVAEEAGQIINFHPLSTCGKRVGGDGEKLYSENIY